MCSKNCEFIYRTSLRFTTVRISIKNELFFGFKKPKINNIKPRATVTNQCISEIWTRLNYSIGNGNFVINIID